MSIPDPVFPSCGWAQMLAEATQRSSRLHGQFLGQRHVSLAGMKSLIELQLRAGAPAPAARPALFTSQQLDAFGAGRISDCLGPDFAVYDQRRIPRIPNGDLKMMSRIAAIDARRGQFERPAEVVAEYDVPADAWYLRENPAGEIPYALLMEIALQPCGFLSAYLDTYSLVTHPAFYFRNLDGFLKLYPSAALGGQTILTRARMLSSVVSSGTVIQKFAFTLTCCEQVLAEGESVFGYFAAHSMDNQIGLDGGKITAPWRRAAGVSPEQLASSALRFSGGRMHMLERFAVEPNAGRHGLGYVYAGRQNQPQDWYYPYHFYQDPVMPGSLGVEAVLQAMQAYVLSTHLADGLRSPRFRLPAGLDPITWRYRGQVKQHHQQFELEVHITDRRAGTDGLVVRGDASVWIDGLRIYEVHNAAIQVTQG